MTSERKKMLTEKMFTLNHLILENEKEAEVLEEAWKQAEKELTELMVLSGESSFKDLEGRGTFTMKVPEIGIITDKKKFFLHLKDIGDEAIAKVQLGPDAVTEEIMEKIRNAKDDDIDIAIHWQTLQAYFRNKEEVDSLDESTWLPGTKIDVGDPQIIVKLSK